MKRCFDLASFHKGGVKTNPLVGAVLVHDNRIIGEGAHQIFGSAHAEVNAISQVADEGLLRNSSIYVSLEPCFHYGKTPPCVQLVSEKGIPELYLSCKDPFEKVAGKSIHLLREKGVLVHEGIEEMSGLDLIRPFLRGIASGRPYIILKYAQSADGKIGYKDRQVWLTNAFSKLLVHKWRSEADAIMVGTNTALLDNPRLDNRLYFGKKQILRVVADRTLRIPMTHHLMSGSNPTIVLTGENRESADGITYFHSSFQGDYLREFMEFLYAGQTGTLIVEGGAQLLQSFIDANLWDEARVFTVKEQLGSEAITAPILKNSKLVKKQLVLDDELCQYYNDSAGQ